MFQLPIWDVLISVYTSIFILMCIFCIDSYVLALVAGSEHIMHTHTGLSVYMPCI